jgi:hypothetical protein
MTNGCKMMWFFFGSGHGKGLRDRASAVIKRFIQREQLNTHGEKLTNAKKVVSFLRGEILPS